MEPLNKPSVVGMARGHLFFRNLQFLLLLGLLMSLGSGCSPESKKARHLQRAEKYLASAQYESSLIEYMNVLKQDGQDPQAIAGVGLVHFARNDFPEAFPFLAKAVELNPSSIDLRLKLSTIYLLAGENEETRKHVAVVLVKEPNNFEALKLWASSATTPEQIKDALDRLNAAAPAIQDKSRLQVLLGRLYRQKSDLVSAEKAFKTAQELDPASRDAHLILGDLYISTGRTNLAGREFETATQVAPTNATAWFEWAEFKRKTGELAESKKVLAGMVQRNPEHIKAWYRLAQIAAAEGDFKDALAKLDSALKREPEYLEALALKTRIQLAQGATVTTLEELNRLANKYPKFAEFQYLLATGYVKNREPIKAVNAAQKATSLATNYTDAVLLLAELRIRTGDAKTAVKSLQEMMERQPELVRAHVLLGSAYLASQQPALAVAAYRKVTELIPASDRAFYLLGLAALAQNDSATATTSLEQVLSLNPRSFDALARLVDMWLAKKDQPSAVVRVRKQIEILPGSVPLYLLLGRVYLSQGDAGQAEAAYRKAIELEPDQLGGYQMLSQVLAGTGRVTEAVKTIETAMAKNPEDLATLTLAGSIFQNQAHDFPRAAAVYEKVLAAQPDSALVANNLAGLYLGPLKDKDKAYDYASKAYKLTPEQPIIQDTLGWSVYQRGDYKRALGLLNSSATAMPKQAEALYHLGMAQAAVGQERISVETLRRAVALSTNFPGADSAALTLAVLTMNPEHVTEKDLPTLQALLKSDPGQSSAIFRLALLAEQQQDLDKARKSLEALVEKNSDYFPASVYLADIYSARSGEQSKAIYDKDKAYDYAQKAYKQAPEQPAVLDTLGWCVYQLGDYKRALSLLNSSANALRGNPKTTYHLGMTQAALGQERQSRDNLQLALTLSTNFPGADRAALTLAVLGVNITNIVTEKDLPTLQALLKSEPGQSATLFRMALLAAPQQGVKETCKSLETLLEKNPDYFPAAVYLAEIYSLTDDGQPKALALVKKARETAAGEPVVLLRVATITYRCGDVAQTKNLLNQVAGTAATNAPLQYQLALTCYECGRFDDARAAAALALKINSDFEQADQARRFLEMQEPGLLADDEKKALDQANMVLAKYPGFAPARMLLAGLHEKQGDSQKAAGEYQELLKEKPCFAPALRKLVLLRPTNLPVGQEYDLAMRARKLLPEDPEIARALAKIVYDRKDHRLAMNLLQESSRKLNDTAESLCYLGLCRYHLGDKPGARQSLQRAIALDAKIATTGEVPQILKELP